MRRVLVLMSAVLAAKMAAATQSKGWRDYTYPVYAFAISFPAEPKVETTPYKTAEGGEVEAHVYSLEEENTVYTVVVADFSHVRTEEKNVIGHAIETLAQDGEIKLDIPHRVNRVYGRQLSIAGKDGSHSSIALFYYQRRLYQIVGEALPAVVDTSSDAIRFQQSIRFTNNASNRSPLEPVFNAVSRVFGNN